MHDLESRIRKYYVYSGIVKGVIFSAVGVAFVSQKVPPAVMAIAAIALSLFLIFIELVSIYPRDMRWHRTLVEECRDQYDRRLTDAIAEMGYFGIFRRNWIAETYDELYWKPKKAENGGD